VVPRRVPERLKSEEFRASVSVRVSIDESGNALSTLRRGSGNALVDAWILETLESWKWKPALRDGEPISSSQNFRFDLEVR
jgi:TonB family protein